MSLRNGSSTETPLLNNRTLQLEADGGLTVIWKNGRIERVKGIEPSYRGWEPRALPNSVRDFGLVGGFRQWFLGCRLLGSEGRCDSGTG